MIPAKVKRAVEARSGGVCEGCGQRPAVEMHHRKFRSRGGKHEVVNLLHLCGWGNHSGCHGVAHDGDRGVALGWAVNSWDEPRNRPVRDVSGRWWFLLPDGRRVAVTGPEF